MSLPAVSRPPEFSDLAPPLPAFWRQVVETATIDHAQRRVTLHAAHAGEIQRQGLTALIHSVEQSLTPATTRQRRAGLLALISLYPVSGPSDDVAAQETRFNLYHDALRDLPPDIFWAACVECVKTCRFFPLPAELRTHAIGPLGTRTALLVRLRAIRDYERDERDSEPQEPAEVRAARAAQLRELLAAAKPAPTQAFNAADAALPDDDPEVKDIAAAIFFAREVPGMNERERDYLRRVAMTDGRKVWQHLKSLDWQGRKG